MNEFKALLVVFLFGLGMPMIGIMFSDYNKTQIVRVCYEAAKTNHDLKCEEKK